MGNIEPELKKERRKAHKEIVYNNLAQAVLPTMCITAIIFFVSFTWTYMASTYEAYWLLFKHSIRVFIDLIPRILVSQVLVYLLLFAWATITDIINYNRTKK